MGNFSQNAIKQYQVASSSISWTSGSLATWSSIYDRVDEAIREPCIEKGMEQAIGLVHHYIWRAY